MCLLLEGRLPAELSEPTKSTGSELAHITGLEGSYRTDRGHISRQCRETPQDKMTRFLQKINRSKMKEGRDVDLQIIRNLKIHSFFCPLTQTKEKATEL